MARVRYWLCRVGLHFMVESMVEYRRVCACRRIFLNHEDIVDVPRRGA